MQQTAVELVRRLQTAGYETYFAGGCVRDMLLGKEPKDIDIVTSARPEEIEQLLDHTVPVGKQFGVITVLEQGHTYEIATFRSDSQESDGRRPLSIAFSVPEEDARRRDFTINGMFFDPIREEVIDYVDGQRDLEAGIVRFIGDPDQRIAEDYLRILRAVRFKVDLGFAYDPQTERAIQQSASFVTKTSWERIAGEINKLLIPEDVPHTFDQVFLELDRMGLLVHVLPEIKDLQSVPQPKRYHAEGDVFVHTMRCLHSLHASTSLPVIWAVLLHDVGKRDTITGEGEAISFHGHESAGVRIGEAVLERLRFSNTDKEHILWLVKHHMMLLEFEKMRPATRLRWFMHPWFEDLLKVFKADAIGTKPTELSEYNALSQDYHAQKEQKLLEPPKWLVTGQDLIDELGLPPGPAIGELLQKLHDAQLEGVIQSRDAAVSLAKRIAKK